LDTEAARFLRHFGSGAEPSPAAHLAGAEEDADGELDDEDRFVDDKLKLARELMEQYLGQRKAP
jgi:hypothetical protein